MPGNLNDSNQNTLLGPSNSFQDNKDLENANSRLTATNDLLVKSKELLKNDMKKCGCY